MGWQVVFSTRSRQDLRRIVEFIAKDDPAAAERFGFTLIECSESLANAPLMGIPLRERPGTRFFPVGNFLIICRADATRQTVRILRFWHAARGKRPLR